MTHSNKEQDERISRLEDHWAILNSEFGIIKNDISWIKDEFTKLRQGVGELKSKLFYGFVFTITATIITQIILDFYKI